MAAKGYQVSHSLGSIKDKELTGMTANEVQERPIN